MSKKIVMKDIIMDSGFYIALYTNPPVRQPVRYTKLLYIARSGHKPIVSMKKKHISYFKKVKSCQHKRYKTVRPETNANLLKIKYKQPKKLYYFNAIISHYNVLYKHQLSYKNKLERKNGIFWSAKRSFFRELHGRRFYDSKKH